jgi:hypothetical protein
MSRRVSSIIFLALLIAAVSAIGHRVSAQQPAPDAPQQTVSDAPPPSYDTPPAITLVDGTARLLRQGQSQAAVANMPLIEGDRLVTESGRLAVTFPDGSLLHIDRNTTVDFLSMNLMRMLDGRVIFVVAGRGGERPSVDYQIDAPAGSMRVQTAGEYRLSTYSGEVELDVVTGMAALATDQGSVQVEAGERSFAREGEAPSYAQAFNSARLDAFDQWSESQRNADVGTTSAQYLPSELSPYSNTFDRYGRWEDDTSYGYVWYPTASVGWRPYYNGYWDNIGPYGSTWIGYDPWCWPTLHFGRWGFRAGLWFWIPGRHWGPAWVSWGYSPGYYSWCPLDYYNRPVVSLFFGSRFGYRSAFYDPWLCWTVLPRHRFGPGYRVATYAVAGTRLGASERTFAIRRTGPATGFAVARQAGATGSGSRAVARALPGVAMRARPRDSMFADARAMPRGVPSSAGARGSQRAGVSSTAPRYDARSLPYSAAPRSGGAYPGGAAAPRGSVRQATPYDSRTAPSSRAVPRGSDRPSAPTSSRAVPRGSDRPSASPGTPRRYESTPYQYRSPGSTSPRPVTPARPRGESYSAPRYSAPPTRGQSYSMPRYSAPPASRPSAPSYRPYSAPASPRYSAPSSPRYSAPASPRYSAPAAPRYSAPSYSAPSYSAPRYSAPSFSAPAAPRYSAPSYSAPRGPSGGGSYAAPRAGGGGSAPRSGPPASSRPAPSGSARPRGGRGGR